MKKTPQYLLAFYQAGDLYRASDDLDRMTVTDNQLQMLSSIVGDGVLFGWNVLGVGGLDITVSLGSGFIGGVVHNTLSIKDATVFDNAQTQVYMRSNLITGLNQGFPLEVETAASNVSSAVFTDLTPPAVPTNFDAASPEFDVVNLTWDMNTESDFDHYMVRRAINILGPFVVVGTPKINGSPGSPFQDAGLDPSTNYYYQISAIDTSGNVSAFANATPYPVITQVDTRKPAEVTNLRAFPGNAQISIVFDQSASADVTNYFITILRVNPDTTTTVLGTSDNVLDQTAQLLFEDPPTDLTRLKNGFRYRILVQAKNAAGNLSNGVSVDTSPAALSAPLDVTALTATPLVGAIQLDWTASASPSGVAMGQKSGYVIALFNAGVASAPINVGLSVTKTINSYFNQAQVGLGVVQFVQDQTSYLFEVQTIDSFGNLSGGVFVKGETVDTTPPLKPRLFAATPGDGTAKLTWNLSQSPDAAGYNLSYDAGMGFVPDVLVGNVQTYTFMGLPNGTNVTFSIKARDSSGNLSGVTLTVAKPDIDTSPPDIPSFVKTTAMDSQVDVSWRPVTSANLDHYEVLRQEVTQPLNAPPNATFNVLSSTTLGLGLATEFIDIGQKAAPLDIPIVNGHVYAYSVRSVSVRGVASSYSAPILVSPTEGLNSAPNRLEAPFALAATFDLLNTTIDLMWMFDFPLSNGPTSFNVYRSTSPLAGFELVASVPATALSYVDHQLLNGNTYYYFVTAVRDDASPLVFTGIIQPANTVLLAVVKAQGGSIVSITNSQRIVDLIQATIGDETRKRLLAHHHSVKPLNSTPVTAVSALSLIDLSTLKSAALGAMLSPAAKAYYSSLLTNVTTGKAIAYKVGTTYAIDPASVVWNVPFIGDFQIEVNLAVPTAEFELDQDRNVVTFPSPLKNTDVVSVDGLGFNYYVPAQIDNRFRGFDVQLNGAAAGSALVDERLQTVRFMAKQASDAVVTLSIEPVVPDFGAQEGARQVSLSPDIVLSDFATVNQTNYVSASGAFEPGDTAFVLVNGARTRLDNFVDFAAKQIVFFSPLPSGSTVELEIRNREEVQNVLPASRLSGIDASQVKTGQILKAQLPPISHEGRVHELANPVFQQLATQNRYVFAADAGVLGSGVTPYAMFQMPDGNLLLGASNGFLQTHLAPGLLLGAGDVVDSDPNSVVISGVTFSDDQIVTAAQHALATSGRVNGVITLKDVSNDPDHGPSASLTGPCLVELDDGTILVCGGTLAIAGYTSRAYVYDPATKVARRVGDMTSTRAEHACALLPTGRVLVTGGISNSSPCRLASDPVTHLDIPFPPGGTAPFKYLSSCEIYDPTLGSFSVTGSMAQARYDHCAALLRPGDVLSDVLIAGGAYSTSTGQFEYAGTGDVGDPVVKCDQSFYEFHLTSSAERFSQSSFTWRDTGSMNNQTKVLSSKLDTGKLVVNGTQAREIYDPLTETWVAATITADAAPPSTSAPAFDGPIKQFFALANGDVLAVTRSNVFISSDDAWVKMTGLDAIGVVHRVSQSENGTMFAATDLGVYEITPDIAADNEWFQGGLIGAGTTESFDLQPVGADMLAGTEIGIFSSSDDGNTWVQLIDAPDVHNIELMGTIVFANSGQDVYRSDDSGSTWAKVATLTFIDSNAIMVARSPLDLFFATGTGLYVSGDGVSFDLVQFDRNKSASTNNVSMATLIGGDLFVGYDNVIFSIGPTYQVAVVAEFAGVVPTVRVNHSEVRSGFRYDTVNNAVVFELKRLVADQVEATSNYSLYELPGGGWYPQNPNAAVQVYVNDITRAAGTYATDSILGEVAFSKALSKPDVVTVSVAGTTLKGAGEFFHREIEDRLGRQQGLPLGMQMDYAGNLLQAGVSIEHNFQERGIDRDGFYCTTNGLVDRSFNAFLKNAEFSILGRREYDVFNSTIDYALESDSPGIGSEALVALSTLEYPFAPELWVGTDSGIFALDLNTLAVVNEFQVGANGSAVRSLGIFNGEVISATSGGIFMIDNGDVATRNPGGGLPQDVFTVSSLNNVLIAGTNDTIYYSDDSSDPPYGVWFRATFSVIDQSSELFVGGPCASILVDNGAVFAAIGGTLYDSTDGKSWRAIYSFQDPTIKINAIASLAGAVLLGTNKGVYSDARTARTNVVSFRIEITGANEADSATLYVNDMFTSADSLYVVGVSTNVFRLQNEIWTTEAIPGLPSLQKVVVLTNGKKVIIANNAVFVE